MKVLETINRKSFNTTRDMVSYLIKELQILSNDLKQLDKGDVIPADIANDIDIILKPFNRH